MSDEEIATSDATPPPAQHDSEKMFEILRKSVNGLIDFLDHYVDHQLQLEITQLVNRKEEDTEAELIKVISIFDEYEKCLTDEDKPEYFYLRGRALNILPKHRKEAEFYLMKSLQLNPNFYNRWTELGKCFFPVNIGDAEKCFNKSLEIRINKVALRMSAVTLLEKVYETAEDEEENIDIALDYANQALRMDVTDGLNWLCLGNVYLRMFHIKPNPTYLQMHQKAYLQAEKDPIARRTSVFNVNRGKSCWHNEQYKEALEYFHRSAALYASWGYSKLMEDSLIKYLNDVIELSKNNGKMKKRQLHQLINSIDPKQLGPSSTEVENVKLTEIPFSGLQLGTNEKSVVLGKVVCVINTYEILAPFTFCMVDKDGGCLPVVIRDMPKSRGVKIGDSVAIPEPVVKDYDFKYINDVEYKFRLVVALNPLDLVVNCKKLTSDKILPAR